MLQGDDSVIDCIVKDDMVILQPSYNEKGIRHNIPLKLSVSQTSFFSLAVIRISCLK